MAQLDKLEPFGPSNEKPVLRSSGVYLAEPPRAVGDERTHLMLRLRRGNHVLKAMAFNLASRLPELAPGASHDVVYTPRWNCFRGTTNLELELHDFRAVPQPARRA
jgi:single-stranded-DNA-specific exonuclease